MWRGAWTVRQSNSTHRHNDTSGALFARWVGPSGVNSQKQFLESQDSQAAVTEAVIDNQGPHYTMADYFFTDGPGINGVILALADAFYEAAIDEPTNA